MANWQERLRDLKRQTSNEQLEKLQKESLEEEKKRKAQFQQQQIEFEYLKKLGHKKGELQREFEKFQPEKLLINVREQIWGEGKIERWEGYNHKKQDLYVATGLVYTYPDLVSYHYGASGYSSQGDPLGSVGEKLGESKTCLIVGIVSFGKDTELFLNNDFIPCPSFALPDGRRGLISTSDPEALTKLQDAIAEDCQNRLRCNVLPKELAKSGKKRILESSSVPWLKKIFI